MPQDQGEATSDTLEVRRCQSELRGVLGYLSEEDRASVELAINVATEAHKGQTRASGESFITHPLEVAIFLAKLQVDVKCVVSAVLHDVLEDTYYTKAKIAQIFDDEIAQIVEGLTKIEKIPSMDRNALQAESFRKMLMAMSKDVRVLVTKLADRLHNMQTLCYLSAEKQKRVASETLYIYAPMARRLGMSSVSLELENLSFRYLNPFRYQVIDHALRQIEGHNDGFLNEVKEMIRSALDAAKLNYLSVISRKKHTYSVYKKMRYKNISFASITDVFAIRVCTRSLLDCYSALGLLHQMFKPMLSRFKDYVALPKANGYQSLHTVLFGPKGTKIEVQIRSREMDEVANTGVAAHFLYKDGGGKRTHSNLGAYDWFTRLMHMQKGEKNALEFMEHVKVDLYPGEVYVFAPSGAIIELPKGATVIDFAYAVHTNVGNQCVLAKVNQITNTLSAVLKNGDSVEVVTSPEARPHKSWLSFVVTGRARSSIRDYFNKQRKEELVRLGRQMLTKHTDDIDDLLQGVDEAIYEDVAGIFDYKSFSQVLEALALGNLSVGQVIEVLKNKCSGLRMLDVVEKKPLLVTGKDHLSINYANCCHPIPGDKLVGFLSAGEGIFVHQHKCAYAKDLIFQERYERLSVEWSGVYDSFFKCRLELDLVNQRGVLAAVALQVADLGSNIEEVKTESCEEGYVRVWLMLRVSSRAHLSSIVKHLRRETYVLRMRRDYISGESLEEVESG